MYLCDCHTHTRISQDSQAPLARMVCAAENAGLSELCVTDHSDLVTNEGNPVTSFDWPAALAQFHAVQSAGGLTLRLGLELGSAPYDPDTARRILAGGGDELDFVLGSLHNWLGVRDNHDLYFTHFGDLALCRQAVENCLTNTWTLVTRCADCYDSLAHIIYPLRYVKRDGNDLDLADYEDQVRAIFTEVARTGHAMEVNTNRGRSLADWIPLLRWFRECGGELVTLGSDAHRPEDVGLGISAALELLREAGFTHVTTFEKRRPVLHKI